MLNLCGWTVLVDDIALPANNSSMIAGCIIQFMRQSVQVKKMQTSPATALDSKHFSSEYWRWQSRFLQDAVLQFGNSCFFITINPYEWDFPQPKWMERVLLRRGALPTSCGAMETMHIAHVLEQLCKGYITGCNDQQWEKHEFKHVFNDKDNAGKVAFIFTC